MKTVASKDSSTIHSSRKTFFCKKSDGSASFFRSNRIKSPDVQSGPTSETDIVQAKQKSRGITKILQSVIQRTPEDDIRRELRRSIRETELERLQRRRANLRSAFNRVSSAEAMHLYERLTIPYRQRDSLGRLFQERIASATRTEMLGILRSRIPPSVWASQVGGRPGTAASRLANLLDVTGGAIRHRGNVTARPGSSPDVVVITAPRVTLDATVALKRGVRLGAGNHIDTGPIQNVLRSRRIGIYRRGGSPTGDIVARNRTNVNRSRDAMWRSSTAGPVPSVPEPWYSTPEQITDANPSARIHLVDEPGFDLHQTIGNGQLTEIRGSDNLITSVGAQRNTDLAHLKSTHWKIPWNLNVSGSRTGTGGSMLATDSRATPTVTTGPISAAIGYHGEWVSFANLTEAMAASPRILMENLIPSWRHDRANWRIIVDALKRMNPTFSVQMTVVSTVSSGVRDNITVEANGHLLETRGPFLLGRGGVRTLTFDLLSLFDPKSIRPADSIEFKLTGVGTPVPEIKWDYPFYNQTSSARFTRGNGGHYTMTGRLR